MYFKRVLRHVFGYKKEFILNVFFSVLYAFFSAVAFLSLMPMLEVLFNGSKKITVKPILAKSESLGNFIENWLNFQVSSYSGNDNQKAILFVVGIVIVLFFLKNVASYFALFFSTIIRNRVIKDLKESIYNKIIVLPIDYFAKNKGFTYTQLRFERDLDSWKMNFSWVPFSNRESWYFFIGIKSGFLSDLKYDKRREPDKRL